MKRLVLLFVLLASVSHAGATLSFEKLWGDIGSEPDTTTGARYGAGIEAFKDVGIARPYASVFTYMDGTEDDAFRPSRVQYTVGVDLDTGVEGLHLIGERFCDHHIGTGFAGEEHTNQKAYKVRIEWRIP